MASPLMPADSDKWSDSELVREYHLMLTEAEVASSNAAELLATSSGLSASQVKSAMAKGAVWVTPAYVDKSTGRSSPGKPASTRRIRRKSARLQVNDELHFYYNPKVLAMLPKHPELVADEQRFSVWLKPAGVFSQGSKWGDHCAMERLVAAELENQRDTYMVHRLDRATSGLMLVAHDKGAAAQLGELFRNRQITKRYQAVVSGKFPESDVSLTSPIDEKSARTQVRLHRYCGETDRSYLLVDIGTGRKHQIRIHLAREGFPIIGDRLHGNVDPGTETLPDLQLAAVQLEFASPFDGEQKCYQWDAFGYRKLV